MKKAETFTQEINMDEKLLHGLLDINHKMRMLYEGKASQSRILIILYEQGVISQKELTTYLGIQPGSASEILLKLEKAGLITRIQSETDRRTMEIRLTNDGKTLAQEAIERRRKRHEQMFMCLTPEEKNQLFSLLEKIDTDWENRFSFSHGNDRQEKQICRKKDREG